MRNKTRIKLKEYLGTIITDEDELVGLALAILDLRKVARTRLREENIRCANIITKLEGKLREKEEEVDVLTGKLEVREDMLFNAENDRKLLSAKIKNADYVTKKEFEEYKNSVKEPVKKIYPMSELPERDTESTICSINVEALTQGGNWVEGWFYLEPSPHSGEFLKKYRESFRSTNCYQGWRYIKD